MRIPITGVGALTPYGLGFEPLWQAICEGRSSITPLAEPLDLLKPGYGGQVTAKWPELRPLPGAKGHRPLTMTRYAYLGCGGIGSVLADTGIDLEQGELERGLYLASYCNMDVMTKYIKLAHVVADRACFEEGADSGAHKIDDSRIAGGMKRFTGFEFLKLMNNMPTAHGGIQGACKGPCNTFLGFAAAGLQAIGRAGRLIEDGMAEVMLTGGVGASVADQMLMTRGKRGMLSSAEVAPEAAGRPFDKGATGIVPGEASCFIVLGTPQLEEGREAQLLGELTGFATAFEPPANHPGLPVGPEMAVVAARRAIEESGSEPDLVVLTGWSWDPMDRLEARIHAEVLGERAGDVPVITLAPYLGSTEAASGPLGVAVALRAMREGKVPAWPNLTDPIDEWQGPADGVGTPGAMLNALVISTSMEGCHSALTVRV